MRIKSSARITGVGAYVPAGKLTNYDLEKMVDTNDEWIIKRTGVKERRISQKDEYSSDMAVRAVESLIERCNARVDDVDMIIVTTFTPDHMTPTVSALVQGHFGMENAGVMDINSGCTGFVYALCVANSLITCGNSNKILVVASETVSKVVDYTDRNTCVLFGDGAAAMLVERTEGTGNFFVSGFKTDGKLAGCVSCSILSDKINGKTVSKKQLFEQEGSFLYEYVLKNVPSGVAELVDKAGLTLGDINWFVPHSANLRMIEAICRRLDFPMDRTLVSNQYYGNTSSATIPLALWMAAESGKLNPGDKILLYGFGGGLTHGGVIVEW
ncbi:MAG: ketoacyl-ACP synthase III [Clostridiaceae bacterium]|nr:ketoacyl-ACP synthase III [Clostridiaceae bacterium]